MATNPVEFKLSTPRFASSLLFLILINVCLQIGTLIDYHNANEFIEICTSKLVSGHLSGTVTSAILALESWITVSVYIFLLTVIGMKWAKTDTSPGQSNNLNAVKVRDYKKLCRVLGYTSLLYFFLGPLFLTVVISLVHFLPIQLALVISSWLSISNLIQGTFYTTSLLFMETFRQDFLTMFGMKKLTTLANNIDFKMI